ncbi:MAG TPA: LpqB family beta-propeller domain-containing protein [Mycobacteriales bacterium]|jgi:hypothetical protein|nr:LpqB family beta-propeller domain-containing protein [Mycobacteriales bacterium]
MSDRRRLLAPLVVAVVLVAGCAEIPTSGAVRVGRPLSAVGGLGDVDVRVQPPQAHPGMSPTDVVLGFLRAVVNNDGDYEIARSYLSTHAAQTWNATGVTTYDDGSVEISAAAPSGKGRTVSLQVNRRGFVDARGEFSPSTGRLQSTYHLVRQQREWRIDQLPNGVLLSTSDAQRALRLATLYYVDRTHTSLVPEQVLLRPQAIGFTTATMRALLDGPGPWLAPAVRTGFPRGSNLLGNVAVSQDGTAEVNLSAPVRQASRTQLRELAAQVVWTVLQDSQISAVRLLADGAPLNLPGVPAVQTRATWSDYDPAPPQDVPAFYSGPGGWRSATGGSNPSLQSAAGLSWLATSFDGRYLAALGGVPGDQRLLTWHSGGRPETRLSAASLTPPVVDRNGEVVVVASGRRRQQLVVVTPLGRRVRVVAPSLESAPVSALALAPDGSRIAAVVGGPDRGRLLVGRVSDGSRGVVFDGFRNVLPSWTDVRGVAWDGADQLVVTAADDAHHRRLVAVDSDGYSSRVLSTDGVRGEPVDVAAAPGQPLVLVAADAVWVARAAGGWRRVGRGGQPRYPG